MKMFERIKKGFSKLVSKAKKIDAVEAVEISEKVDQTVQKSKAAVSAVKQSGKLDVKKVKAASVKAQDAAKTIQKAVEE